MQHSHGVKCLDITRRKHYQAKIMHTSFGFKSVIRLGSGWWLPKCFGKSWWQWNGVWWGRCTCSWLGRKYSVLLGHLKGVLWIFTCVLSSIMTRKCTVHIALSLRKMPWYHTAEALSDKIYAPYFLISRVWSSWAGAALVITKMSWEKLVAVKWSLVGSMYMLLTRSKIRCTFGASQRRFMNIYMWFKQYYDQKMHCACSTLTA